MVNFYQGVTIKLHPGGCVVDKKERRLGHDTCLAKKKRSKYKVRKKLCFHHTLFGISAVDINADTFIEETEHKKPGHEKQGHKQSDRAYSRALFG